MAEQKFKRKKFFINKRLQIRYMISLLIPMLILIIFIGLVMYYSQYRFLQATTTEMAKDLQKTIQTNIVYQYAQVDTITCETNQKIVADIKSKIGQYKSGDQTAYANLLSMAYKILFLGLFIVFVELAVLTIFISHKIAGPVYRLVKFSEDLLAGHFSAKIYLRKGDELTDLAMDFNRAGDFISETHRRAMSVGERAVDMIKSGNADKDKLTLLEKELQDLKARIKTD